MKKSRFTDRTKWKIIIVLMVGMVVVALFLQAGILMYVNSKNLDKTSQMLLDQSISIIEKNQKNEIDLIRSMKEDYVIRARAVSYILESRLEAENDTEELQKIASLMSIDEIYLFDATGKIYSGTKPEYYGYSFDSGEQMEYFKPMLENKGLTMCQDITPNTSEGRSMMYAITWNSTGDKMIQVGIEPVRLLAEIKQNDVSTVVSNMPMYQGMNLYVADLDTHEILGATDENTIGKKLEAIGIYTMGDVARCSIGKPNEYYNEELLYRMFGINAELLIDHAWGWEPCRMQDIKAYRPETNSICSGQVLQCPYPYDKARLVVREMAEAVAMDLLEKRLVTDQLTLTVGYDIENTAGGNFRGEIVTDRYGRKIPKHAHGTANLPRKTSSVRSIMDAILGIYDGKVNPKLSIRRITITANKIVSEDDVPQEVETPVQFNLFDDIAAQEQQHKDEEIRLERERKIQEAMLGIKKKFGKNAILNGGSYLDGATARERNGQIGGHKA